MGSCSALMNLHLVLVQNVKHGTYCPLTLQKKLEIQTQKPATCFGNWHKVREILEHTSRWKTASNLLNEKRINWIDRRAFLARWGSIVPVRNSENAWFVEILRVSEMNLFWPVECFWNLLVQIIWQAQQQPRAVADCASPYLGAPCLFKHSL